MCVGGREEFLLTILLTFKKKGNLILYDVHH